MPRRIVIYPYKMGSRSARELARAIGALRVHPDGRYRPRLTDVVINWGSSTIPNWDNNTPGYLNHPENVGIASNKYRALIGLRQGNVPHPEFTADRAEAQRWIDANDGTKVIERHRLNGHSGDGISIKEFGQDISPAPLYVKYIKKAQEFRVHVFNGEVIDVQEKRKRRELDREDVNFQVRSYQNGWVFCRDGIEEPNHLREISIRAISSVALDFGAVDVIYNQHQDQCYVLEINTACGLEGSTVNKYADVIRRLVNG